MSIAALIRQMAAAGAPAEAIALAVEAIEAEQNKAAERRAKAAERKRKQRERDSHATVTGQSQDKDGTTPAPSPSSPNPNNPTPTHVNITISAREAAAQVDADFETFYAAYPSKKAKPKAHKAYVAARKDGASHEAVMTGLAAYLAFKPDWQDWAHPASWLNGKRWGDVYEPQAPRPANANRGGYNESRSTVAAGRRLREESQALDALERLERSGAALLPFVGAASG